MEKQHELEWAEAQNISITVDLVAAAKQQLRFLGEVDKNRQLHDGPALDRAIYRYKYCWLPLLSKHVEAQVSEGCLVVPLDCEWIWHCHRLNPVRYISDCKEFYGKILGTRNVVSSTQATCTKQTEDIWKRMYPNEPYELPMNTQISAANDNNALQKSTNYDLISAVKRQSSFYYQVSRPHMNDDTFLEESVARYKGFLHLIKRNKERSIKLFCVPTYDIDLIWHSHLLQPVAYCKDQVAIMGRVLQHDDTVSDKTEGKKLDAEFLKTTKHWGDTFGIRYWRAGAMHRDGALSPPTINPSKLATLSKKVVDCHLKKMFVEVMVEIVEARGLPAEHRGNIFVTFSKKQPDLFFYGKTRSIILSETGEKQAAVFQFESAGELVCDLVSYSPTVVRAASPAKVLGTTSICLQDLMKPGSPHSIEKWFELTTNSEMVNEQPINLRMAISFTPPARSPFMLNLAVAHPFPNSCVLLPSGRFSHSKGWTYVHGIGKKEGWEYCDRDSNFTMVLGVEKMDEGGNCDGESKFNRGANCNGGSSCGSCGSPDMAGDTLKGSHCIHTEYGVEDIVKSSGCGGCGGGCRGGGCRGGGCGGGCHSSCGYENK